MVESSAELLYGLLHARWVFVPRARIILLCFCSVFRITGVLPILLVAAEILGKKLVTLHSCLRTSRRQVSSQPRWIKGGPGYVLPRDLRKMSQVRTVAGGIFRLGGCVW